MRKLTAKEKRENEKQYNSKNNNDFISHFGDDIYTLLSIN